MRRNWTRDELILAFSLYCKTPFGKLHSRNPDIIKLSILLDRTSSSVALKLVNFSSLDPLLAKRGIKGMSNYSKLDKKVFDEFNENWEKLLLESEQLYEDYEKLNISEKKEIKTDFTNKVGEDKIVKTKQRKNQNIFRKIVLSNYDETCAICHLNYPSLLIASHIIPWKTNQKERLNPRNGLCLCSIHDKAFDQGLISFDSELRLIVSKKILNINKTVFDKYFGDFIQKKINDPKKFVPSIDFIKYHRDKIFISS